MMQTIMARGGKLGLRALQGVTCQLHRPLPGAFRARVQQAGLRTRGSQPGTGRPSGPAESGRPLFRTFSSTGGGSGGSGGAGGGGSGGGSGGSGGGKGGSGGGGLWAAYLALLDRKPLVTKAVTAAVLNGLGDIVAQLAFENGKFDLRRLGVFAFLGLVLIGPALHFWYGSLGRLITAKGTAGTLLKLAADQFFFAPIFISGILGMIMALEGQAAGVPDKLRQDLFMIVRSNWALWIPFQFFNFRFVPGNLQVLASNVCALAWNTYMSYVSHRTADH